MTFIQNTAELKHAFSQIFAETWFNLFGFSLNQPLTNVIVTIPKMWQLPANWLLWPSPTGNPEPRRRTISPGVHPLETSGKRSVGSSWEAWPVLGAGWRSGPRILSGSWDPQTVHGSGDVLRGRRPSQWNCLVRPTAWEGSPDQTVIRKRFPNRGSLQSTPAGVEQLRSQALPSGPSALWQMPGLVTNSILWSWLFKIKD